MLHTKAEAGTVRLGDHKNTWGGAGDRAEDRVTAR